MNIIKKIFNLKNKIQYLKKIICCNFKKEKLMMLRLINIKKRRWVDWQLKSARKREKGRVAVFPMSEAKYVIL